MKAFLSLGLQRLRGATGLALSALLAIALTACGGAGSDTETDTGTADTGTVYIGITDAPGALS